MLRNRDMWDGVGLMLNVIGYALTTSVVGASIGVPMMAAHGVIILLLGNCSAGGVAATTARQAVQALDLVLPLLPFVGGGAAQAVLAPLRDVLVDIAAGRAPALNKVTALGNASAAAGGVDGKRVGADVAARLGVPLQVAAAAAAHFSGKGTMNSNAANFRAFVASTFARPAGPWHTAPPGTTGAYALAVAKFRKALAPKLAAAGTTKPTAMMVFSVWRTWSPTLGIDLKALAANTPMQREYERARAAAIDAAKAKARAKAAGTAEGIVEEEAAAAPKGFLASIPAPLKAGLAFLLAKKIGGF